MEAAAVIRAALKAHGWSSRMVSVRSDYNSISVRVKSALVPISVVEAIANEHKRINRCEYSGEILSGGNVFVSVRYESEALEAIVAELLPKFEAFGPGDGDDIEGISVFRDKDEPDYFRAYGDNIKNYGRKCWGAKFFAEEMAGIIANARALLCMKAVAARKELDAAGGVLEM